MFAYEDDYDWGQGDFIEKFKKLIKELDGGFEGWGCYLIVIYF